MKKKLSIYNGTQYIIHRYALIRTSTSRLSFSSCDIKKSDSNPIILTQFSLFRLAVADVKIKREHVKGSDDLSGDIKPEIEPITEETVRRMENPGSVEVCKSSANKN